MITQAEAIIAAFQGLGGKRTIREIEDWVTANYGDKWKDFSTQMADMVPLSHGGNGTSSVPDYFRVLERVQRGTYCLID
ncbi:MAG TPA: hypothetical protein DEF42_12935 [Desulfosporosinus sp.]|nr:hypothetical protein [Desulfosporosinus sp.]